MALALFDRVQETTTTTGTGSVTLGGAVPGFQSFAVVGNGNTCYYTIVDGSAWEVGTGTYSTSGPTLARTTVLSNSNGNTSPITLAAGTKSVFLTYPAGKSVNLNESGNVSPLGTVSSGVWQGTTVGVAYGGTGVTSSSGANSVVLRDASQNITVNRINQGLLTTTASGGTTTLTAASAFNQALVGTGGHTYRLPDATTLSDTTTFQFNNNATGTLTIQNNAGTAVGTIASGGAAGIALLSNATVGGTWDVHAYIPENVTWGTNSLALGSTVISGGTWQGGTIQPAYGGTGLTSYTSGGAVYANSSTTLTSGTLPVTAGGTGATTASGAQSNLNVPSTTGSGASGTWGINITGSAGSLPNAVTFNSGGAGDASGTSFNGAAARTISYNTIGAPSTSGTNASGTWSINVTGSAGSASSATTSTYVTSQDIRTLSPSSTAAARMAFGFTSWANNNSGPYADYLAMRSYIDASGGNDNLLMLNKSTIAMRVYQQAYGSATAYSSYADVLMSNNYNSYAPTLSGSGATGTWAINISGNAATATLASNSNAVAGLVPAQFYNNMGNNHTAYTNFNSVPNFGNYFVQGSTNGPTGIAGNQFYGFTLGLGNDYPLSQYGSQIYYPRRAQNSDTYIYVRDIEAGTWTSWVKIKAGYADSAGSAGSVDYNALTNKGGGTGSYITSGDYRAPIFYDSDNTARYLDPAGTSSLSVVKLTGNDNQLQIDTVTNGASGIFFQEATANKWEQYHYQGQLRFYSYTTASQEAFFDNSGGYFQVRTSVRAPIFYDSDNTGYYVDPNSNSRLSSISVPAGSPGFVNAARGSNFGYSSGYGTIIYGVTSGSVTPCFNVDPIANPSGSFNGNGGEVMFRNGVQFISPNSSNNGYNNYFVLQDGYAAANNSFRAPIFYDTNDSSYYGDFASTSNINAINFVSNLTYTGSSGLKCIDTSTYDGYVSMRVVRNAGSGNLDGMYIGYANSNSGVTRIFGGGSTGGELVKYATYTEEPGSFRAPIFYDSNDTAYYLNPNGLSYISSVQIVGYNSASSALMLNWPTSGYIGLYGSVVNSAKLLNFRGTGGDTYRVSTAQMGGAAYINGDAAAGNESGAVIIAPGGGRYATTASTVTGAIKITIPEPVSDVMCTMTIRVYTYDGAAFEITCGGYPYGTSGTSGFVNSFAYMNTQRRGALTVRFGTDGSNACVWIGETGTTWNYPQVQVIDFTTGYYGRDPKHYTDGWTISFVGAFNTVFNSVTVYAPVNSSANSGPAYAPIYYDSDDTAYYVDPAGTSRIRKTNLIASGSGWDDGLNLYSSDASNRWNVLVDAGASNWLRFAYNQSEKFRIQPDGAVISFGDIRATIFYDQNNTGYYVDPNSTSNLNQVNLQSFLRRNTSAAGYLEGNYGTSTDGNSSSCIYTIGGAYQPGTTSLGNMYGCGYTVGSGTSNPGLGMTGWGFYAASGGTSRVFLDSDNGVVISSGSTRSPIFYDRDNTSYYVDPTGSTSLRTTGDWRSDSIAWTGEFAGKMQYHSNNWYLQYSGSMLFRNSGGTNVMNCDSAGNVTFNGNVTAYSDARIKENVVTIDSALDKVLNLRGVYYNKIGTPERRVGVIAQEIETVLPEVVRLISDTNPSTGETQELLAVDYGNIAGLLIEATKEQNQEVVDLRNRVAQLESLIHKLIGD